MSAKKWCIGLFSSIGLSLLLIAVTVIYVDPYAHYHEPIANMDYSAKGVYLNDGLTRHCKYEAIITGTSTSEGFDEDAAMALFHKPFLHVPFPGEGYRRISENIQVGFENNQDLNMVIWGLDPMWFIADADNLGYDEYPEYLYDNDLWNDVNYLFNGHVLVYEIIKPLCAGPERSKTDIVSGYDDNQAPVLEDGSINTDLYALNNYDRPEKGNYSISASETAEKFEILDRSLQQNVISIIEEHPDAEFYIFFPPYSILWWDSLHQSGEETLNRRLRMEQFAIEELIKHENVRLFSFADNFDLTCNLNHYLDDVHYRSEVYSWILYCMKNGEHELTEDNYEEYLQNISDFYQNYNYDRIFEALELSE